MKNLLIALGVFLFQTTSSHAFIHCADFTGSWAGKCEGTDPASGGPTEIEIKQPSCESITLLETTLLIDRKWHEIGGAKYTANWVSLIPEVSNLRIQYTSQLVGVGFNLEYNLIQSHDGMQIITSSASRSFAGETEQLANCTLRRK